MRNQQQHRLQPDGHGSPVRADFSLVVPLAHEATAMRTTDTAASQRDWSGAVCQPSNRPADFDSTNRRSTRAIPTMPGTRTSTMATPTSTTRTTKAAPAPSAARSSAAPTFGDLVQAYFDCRQHKRNTPSALAFEANLERNLAELYGQLVDGTYAPGRSICFVVTRQKPREVWAADFRDRIVHHLLYIRIGPAIERTFIADSCACIPGRGTLYAARRLDAKVRSVTQNWSRPAHYLKCDLANFFVSIDKRILAGQLAARITEPWWRELALQILWHDPRTDVDVRGEEKLAERVPPHKRLGNQPAHLGLPIGNLSSQFFANVYLDALDQHAKHIIGARHYIRYVDDFLILHESPQWLLDALRQVRAFLPQLGVALNDAKTILQPVDRGVDFVGQVIKPWRRQVRRRTVAEALRRVGQADDGDLFETTNSYFGLLRHASSHHDRARLAKVALMRGSSVNRQLTQVL